MYHDITLEMGETLQIGDEIKIHLRSNHLYDKRSVKMVFDVPRSVHIMRHELIADKGNKQ